MPIQTIKYTLRGQWWCAWRLLVVGLVAEFVIVNAAFQLQDYLLGGISVLALTLPMMVAVSSEPVIGIFLAIGGAVFFVPDLSPGTKLLHFCVVIVLWVLSTSTVAVLVQREHRERDALVARLFEAERRERLVEIRERRRIAQDLHDDTIQVMVGALLKLDAVCNGNGAAIPVIESAVAALREATTRTRRMMFELRPPDPGKLKVTLQALCTELQRETGIHSQISMAPMSMSHETEQLCHRVMLESVNNVRKHAQATNMRIAMRSSHECLYCSVQDDGVGFDITTNARPQDHHLHLGILSCEERLYAAGGHYLVTSTPGVGTRVVFDMPLRRSE